MLSSPSEDQGAGRANTHATSTVTERYGQMYHLTGQNQDGNPCLLFVIASVVQLNLGPGVNAIGRFTTVENAF